MARFTLIEAVDSRDQRPYYWLFERIGSFQSRVAVLPATSNQKLL